MNYSPHNEARRRPTVAMLCRRQSPRFNMATGDRRPASTVPPAPPRIQHHHLHLFHNMAAWPARPTRTRTAAPPPPSRPALALLGHPRCAWPSASNTSPATRAQPLSSCVPSPSLNSPAPIFSLRGCSHHVFPRHLQARQRPFCNIPKFCNTLYFVKFGDFKNFLQIDLV